MALLTACSLSHVRLDLQCGDNAETLVVVDSDERSGVNTDEHIASK
jgi:hypothetical protein